jgi:hypothetical protein
MKAYLQIALLAIFIIGINGQVTVCEEVNGDDEDVCRMYPTEEDYTHCCYVELSGNGKCRQLNDDQYENVKRYKDFLKSQGNTDVKIKCAGEFLTFSLFALLAFLF